MHVSTHIYQKRYIHIYTYCIQHTHIHVYNTAHKHTHTHTHTIYNTHILYIIQHTHIYNTAHIYNTHTHENKEILSFERSWRTQEVLEEWRRKSGKEVNTVLMYQVLNK